MFAHVRLVLDIVSIKLLVWMFGTDGELLDSHLFFSQRYSELARWHRRRGHTARADVLEAVAATHRQLTPDDDLPPAAEMVLRVPRPRIVTDAVSKVRVRPRRDPERSPAGMPVP